MTTTVKRGAGRPAAAAKTSRHAQRTPLPPKPGMVESAQEVLATIPVKQRRSAKAAAVQDAKMAVDQKTDQPGGEDHQQPVATATELPDSPNKSQRKAQSFILAIGQFGWKSELATAGNTATVTARRGTEVLHQSWQDGVWSYAESTYTMADRTLKPRNVSDAVRRFASRPPEAAEQEHERVGSNKAWRRKPTNPRRGRLPFDAALATDEQVITALVGQTVVWHNRYREQPETALVGRDSKKIHITEYKGERIVNFCCPVGGFRSFRLSDLLQVKGGKGQKAAAVEEE